MSWSSKTEVEIKPVCTLFLHPEKQRTEQLLLQSLSSDACFHKLTTGEMSNQALQTNCV